MWQMQFFFFILGYFLLFYPSDNPKNQNLQKMKKALGHVYQKLRLHDVQLLRYSAWQTDGWTDRKSDIKRGVPHLKTKVLYRSFTKYIWNLLRVTVNLDLKWKFNMESPPPGRWGDNFIGPLGTLHFHLPLGENTVFSTGGMERVPPHWPKITPPPPNFYSPHQWFLPPSHLPLNLLNSTFLLKIFPSE